MNRAPPVTSRVTVMHKSGKVLHAEVVQALGDLMFDWRFESRTSDTFTTSSVNRERCELVIHDSLWSRHRLYSPWFVTGRSFTADEGITWIARAQSLDSLEVRAMCAAYALVGARG